MNEAVRESTREWLVRGAGAYDMEPAADLVTVGRLTNGTLAGARHAADAARIAAVLSGQTWCSGADGDASHVRSWLASSDGRVVGFASTVESIDCLRITELIVDPRERNRGIGASLLCRALDVADGLGLPIVALVRETDVRGLQWLCDRGFSVGRREADGRVAIDREAFASDGVDGITLVRPAACTALVRIAE